MTDMQHERRGARRVDAKLSLRIQLPAADGSRRETTLETINISTSGVYFRSDVFVEPMTKLALELELPVAPAAGEASPDTERVAAEGLVVRTLPEIEDPAADGYEVAVFFTHLEPGAAAVLERHLAALMAQDA